MIADMFWRVTGSVCIGGEPAVEAGPLAAAGVEALETTTVPMGITGISDALIRPLFVKAGLEGFT